MKYRVKVTETHVGYVEVEARNKEEAEREAAFTYIDLEFEATQDVCAIEIGDSK